MKKVAIVQSNYIPWKGYFDLIDSVDEFILFDTAQYTKRDWRNRNKIPTPQGLQWLTIPVMVKGRYFQPICEVKISDNDWAKNHWMTLEHVYKRAPHFEEISFLLKPLYQNPPNPFLSDINAVFLRTICEFLSIKTKITCSMDYKIIGESPSERLLNLCLQAGATEYISGPTAKSYLEVDLFEQKKIKVSFFDYSGYLEYKQLTKPFEHFVSIVDVLFCCGQDSRKYIKSGSAGRITRAA